MDPADTNAGTGPVPPQPAGVSGEIHRAIYAAIESRHLVEVETEDHKRIGEPHDYGIMNGKPTLLFYQTAGYSRSGGLPQWRHLHVATFRAVRQSDKTFGGGRSIKSGRHHGWDALFIRARPIESGALQHP